ncbi:biotin--[acetyl-CoA-carboxylase] ligase [Kriegella sp. EG-1]|nr:biotin--[acetyl-CoA-carboxylase] ligase [Flavobacteriaceae bacterium EG-1]
MHIIKLNATDSTNQYLKNLLLTKFIEDFTVVTANKQTKARGQMGTTWQSDTGKNLTFSILKQFDHFLVQNQYYLNITVSLAVYAFLKTLNVPNLAIKWPNDILSGNQKICGILIENVLQGQHINSSIIGIGLNVNQTEFHNLFNVSSLKLLLGEKFNLDELLYMLLNEIKSNFDLLNSDQYKFLDKAYLAVLYRKDLISNFKDANGMSFTGTITGISSEGKLIVQLADFTLREYNMKEIKLLN